VGRKPVPSLHSVDHEKIVGFLSHYRATANLTQVEVCERMGKDETFVSKVERGVRRLDFVELVPYLRALGLDAKEGLAQLVDLIDA